MHHHRGISNSTGTLPGGLGTFDCGSVGQQQQQTTLARVSFENLEKKNIGRSDFPWLSMGTTISRVISTDIKRSKFSFPLFFHNYFPVKKVENIFQPQFESIMTYYSTLSFSLIQLCFIILFEVAVRQICLPRLPIVENPTAQSQSTEGDAHIATEPTEVQDLINTTHTM